MNNMKDISVDSRHNIGVEDMVNYKNGGLCIDEMHTNGVSIYVPYGLYNDIFKALGVSVRSLEKQYSENIETIATYKDSESVEAKYLVDVLENTNESLMKSINILEAILPLGSEI